MIAVPPLSKFGITPVFIFRKEFDANGETVYFYSKTNSHSYMRNAKIKDKSVKVISPIQVDIYEKDYE